MWTAKIISVLKSAGRIAITVRFSNGSEQFEKEFQSTSKVDMIWLKNQVRVAIEGFQDAYAFADTLAADQPIDLTPPTAPTRAETDQTNWIVEFARLQRAQKLVDLGIIAANNAKFAALKAKVTSGLQPEYIDII